MMLPRQLVPLECYRRFKSSFSLCFRVSVISRITRLDQKSDIIRSITTKLPFEIDTNVTKNVLLYKYENQRLFRLVKLFGGAQFIFWVYLSHFAYTSLRDTSSSILLQPPPAAQQQQPWWWRINLGQPSYKLALTTLFLVLGNVILFGSWFFTLRSVRYLVLLKGGRKVQIATYAPFTKYRTIEMSLEHMTCNHSRNEVTAHLPIKLKGYWMYFLLDKRGTFTNVKLFDYTVGIKRIWS